MKKIPLFVSTAILVIFSYHPYLYADDFAPLQRVRDTQDASNDQQITRPDQLHLLQTDRLATREAIHAIQQDKLREMRARIEEKIATASQRMQEKRAEFQQRLTEVSDERKQRIMEQLVQMYQHKNQRWTDHFLNVLDRLDRILDKLETRMAQAKDNGVDTTTTEEAIATARTAIDTAAAAVEEQAAKEYLIEFTDETTLREAAQTTNQQLRSDLTAVQQQVAAARQAVQEVFQALKDAVEAEMSLSPTGPGSSIAPTAAAPTTGL